MSNYSVTKLLLLLLLFLKILFCQTKQSFTANNMSFQKQFLLQLIFLDLPPLQMLVIPYATPLRVACNQL